MDLTQFLVDLQPLEAVEVVVIQTQFLQEALLEEVEEEA
jgi:hypothetical protein